MAQVVAGGGADAGLGIESAARDKGLGFVPLVRARYHLVCLKSALPDAPVQALLAELESAHWQALLAGLPGYSGVGAHSGKVLSLRAMLPWRSDRKTKAAKA